MDTETRWRPADDVVWCSSHGTTVLLSVDRGRYHTLNPIGSEMWTHFSARKSVAEIAELVAHQWDAASGTAAIIADVKELARDLVQRRLLIALPPATASRRLGRDTVPSVISCVCVLGLLHVSRKLFGLRWVLARLDAIESDDVTRDHGFLDLLNARVCVAASWYPFAAECLDRSLLLTWLMRRAGVDARLRIGVVPRPFEAHAWVECMGQPVNEQPEVLQHYRPLPL